MAMPIEVLATVGLVPSLEAKFEFQLLWTSFVPIGCQISLFWCFKALGFRVSV